VTPQLIIPWIIAVGNVGSAFCTGRGWIAGWPILLITQLGFIAYAVVTGQLGFLLQNVAMAVIAVVNWHRWWNRPDMTGDGVEPVVRLVDPER